MENRVVGFAENSQHDRLIFPMTSEINKIVCPVEPHFLLERKTSQNNIGQIILKAGPYGATCNF